MQLTMEQRILIVKSYCETKSYNQVQNKFRNLFPECLSPNKTAIGRNVKTYERGGTSLNVKITEKYQHKNTRKH